MHRSSFARTLVFVVLGAGATLASAQTKAKPSPAPAKAAAAPAKPAAKPDPIGTILDSGELAAAYNPVLLNYLLEEGRDKLPEAHRKRAVDQLVTRFKKELDISPAEEAVQAAAALGGMLTGGAVGEGLSKGAAGVYGDWVDAALLLSRAGYKDDVIPFFENCLRYSYSEVRLGRCATGLLGADPERAFDVLTRMEKEGSDRRQVALWLLGFLAGQPDYPKDRREKIVDTLISRTQGMLNATYSLAAIRGLVLAKDERAVEPLRKMTKGFTRSEEVQRAAKRALLIGFKDESLVPVLEKDAKGGFGKEEDDKFFAAALLIEGGYDSGFAWAKEQLTKKKGGLLKMKKGNTDLHDEIVWALVNKGGKKSIPVLQAALPVRKPSEWLSAYIAVGLLDLGDATGIEIARQALQNEKWLRTRLEAAEGLAAHGDLSGVPVMKTLIEDRGFFKQLGDMSLGQYRTPEELRTAVVSSLADMDRPEGVDLLLDLLGEKSDEVRTAAAYALGRMKNPRTVEGLKRGLSVDYGKEGARLRSPQVRAHLLRMALLNFGKDPQTKAMVDEAAGSEFLSIKFLALVAALS